MFWKNWPSWLKGGFIGLILSIIGGSCVFFFPFTHDLGGIICLPFLPGLFFVEDIIPVLIVNILLLAVIFGIFGFIKDFTKSEIQKKDLTEKPDLYKKSIEGSYLKGIFISIIIYSILYILSSIMIKYAFTEEIRNYIYFKNIDLLHYSLLILLAIILTLLSFFFIKKLKTRRGIYSFIGGIIIGEIFMIINVVPSFWPKSYNALQYFIFALIISFIYGKIKAKKQQPVQTQPQIQTK